MRTPDAPAGGLTAVLAATPYNLLTTWTRSSATEFGRHHIEGETVNSVRGPGRNQHRRQMGPPARTGDASRRSRRKPHTVFSSRGWMVFDGFQCVPVALDTRYGTAGVIGSDA